MIETSNDWKKIVRMKNANNYLTEEVALPLAANRLEGEWARSCHEPPKRCWQGQGVGPIFVILK